MDCKNSRSLYIYKPLEIIKITLQISGFKLTLKVSTSSKSCFNYIGSLTWILFIYFDLFWFKSFDILYFFITIINSLSLSVLRPTLKVLSCAIIFRLIDASLLLEVSSLEKGDQVGEGKEKKLAEAVVAS